VVKQKQDIEFAITCAGDKYEEQIYRIFRDNGIVCYRNVDINSPKSLELFTRNNIDLSFLLWWPKIVKKKIIESANIGFINLHPSLLPLNRGKHPYYWSIVDNSPAGVSIHYITEKIDDGDILCQKEIPIDITTTADVLYERSIKEMISLFQENYHEMTTCSLIPKKQNNLESSFHMARDIRQHSEINLDKSYKAVDLLNIIRARNFPGGPSSFFRLNGKKYRVNITVTEVVE